MAVYELMIGGIDVLTGLGPSSSNAPKPVISLVDFERSYDEPARLMIRAAGDWRRPPYVADTAVSLLRDGVEVFEGLLDLPRPIAAERGYPVVEYTAFDRSRLLRFPTVLDTTTDPIGNPSISLNPGTLQAVVNQYLFLAGQFLTDKGVDTAVDYLNGAAAIETLPVSLENVTVDAGLRQIAAAAPGVRLILVPTGSVPKYAFVNIFGSPSYDVVIDVTRVPDLSIQQSVEARAGAVKTLGGKTIGSADVTLDLGVDLTPAWDAALEASWEFDNAFGVDGQGAPTAAADVYRKFTYPEGTPIGGDSPVVGLAKVVEDAVNPVWVKVRILSVDTNTRTVLFAQPVLKNLKKLKRGRFDPFEPGRAKKADAGLRYSQSGTASTPVYIASHRVPASGFSGRAYQLAPVTCEYEKILAVPAGVDHQQYAIDAHRAFSEPIVTGSIPLNEDLPIELWNLDRRLNVKTDSHGATNYESLEAPLMGVRVRFERGVSASLEFSRDETEVLAGDGP